MTRRPNTARTSLIVLAALGCTAHAQGLNTTALAPIIVTATASVRDASLAPASVSVVDGDALRRRPVNDLADAVQDTVGLGLENLGNGRRGISVRGMDAAHTLVLVDGQRINTSSAAIAHSDFELGWVPTEAIERVEVVRGPMSSLYGSEALGGVVNIITRPATDHWQGSLSAHMPAGRHDLGGGQRKAGFQASGPLVPGTLGLTVWGEHRRRDALQQASHSALSALLDAQRATTGHAGLVWTPDARQRIDLSVTAGREEQEGTYRRGQGDPYRLGNRVQRRRHALTHSGDWDWGTSRLRLYRSTLERRSSRSDGGRVSGPNRFVDTVLDAQAGFAAGRAHRLTVGTEIRRESLEDPSVNRAGRAALTHHALFAQDEILLGERWELVLGSRADRHARFGWELSPRAYLMFHATDALTLRAGMGRGFRAPALKQLSPEYESRAAIGGRGIIRGNPDLQPETNRSAELGISWERQHGSAGATLFRNSVRNLIDAIRQPVCAEAGRICLAYRNIAAVRLQGLELTAGADLSASWRLDTHYTWLEAHNRTTGNRLPDRSRHRAGLTLAWKPVQPLTTRLRAEYYGSQYRSPRLAERPDYTLLHGYVDYRLGRHLTLHAGIENLTDRRLANDDAAAYSLADEGRRYFIGVTASF